VTEPDRRSRRTKKRLKQTMLELLNKKDISKITVRELSEKADIGRGTFYLHYADAYDLLDKLENELMEKITTPAAVIKEKWDYDNLLLYLESVWQYIYENMDAFKTLMNRRNGTRFMEKFKQHCERKVIPEINKGSTENLTEQYAALYIISGTLGIFQKWMEQNAPVPPGELAEMVRNLIMQ
jgi:AcrR family transcriptional regulator